MASTGNFLSEEFKCPICLGDVTNPKYMGPCQHTACLLCVTSLIWNSSRKDVFPCPVCREDCPVPERGIHDLRDNFQLKAIMEKFKNMPKHSAGIKCAACKNDASHYFCKDCDGIYLCLSCATTHDQNPDTSAHVLIGICKDDGKTLTKFCGGCNQAVCSACRIAKHSGGSHDVNPHDKVVEVEITKINEEIATLEGNIEEMVQYREKLQHVHNAVVERIVSDRALVMERSDAAITITEKKRDELSKRRCHLKQKIKELSEELAVLDADLGITDRKITEFTEKRDEYCKDLGHQEQLFSNRLNKAIRQAAAGISEIGLQERIDLGRAKASAKIVLDDNTVPNLVSTREQLQELSIAAVQENDLASFEDLENKMLRFVPGNDDMEIGRLVGDLLIPEYTSIEKVADLAYPPDRPCRAVYRLKHDGDRVLSLHSSGDEGADTICMFDPRLTGECLMKITRNISQGIDMATNSEGELIVLRRTRPAIRAFNEAANTLHNIDVSFDNTLDVQQNWSIETDDKGNIFVLNDENLLVFNTDGAPVFDVNVGKAWKMSFCRPKRLLYIAAHNNIIVYHWGGCVLSHISSRPHGVQGFICGDVCPGSDGEVFVSGIMSGNHEIRIYQIVEAEQTREEEKRGADPGWVAHGEDVSKRDVGEDPNRVFKMTRINFGDNYQPTVINLLPWISVRGNTLVLGYDSKTEVFKLLP